MLYRAVHLVDSCESTCTDTTTPITEQARCNLRDSFKNHTYIRARVAAAEHACTAKRVIAHFDTSCSAHERTQEGWGKEKDVHVPAGQARPVRQLRRCLPGGEGFEFAGALAHRHAPFRHGRRRQPRRVRRSESASSPAATLRLPPPHAGLRHQRQVTLSETHPAPASTGDHGRARCSTSRGTGD